MDIPLLIRKYIRRKRVKKGLKKRKNEKKIVISISLLVSNHIDTIQNCMESIQPLLQAVPSELIVVDTGSTDGSIEVVKQYADKVIPFVWCNDFSAARNAGLKQAQGEWFLYLDDDEWFEDISQIISFFQTKEYNDYDAAWYLVRNYENREGTQYQDAYVGRMCKRVPGLCFEGKIHEHFSISFSNIRYFSSYVHHYGYVFDTPEQLEQKSRRNIPLVEEEWRKNPKDYRMAAQLIQEYMAIKDVAKVNQLVEKIIKENEDSVVNPFLQYILLCQVRIEKIRKDWDSAERKLTQIEQTYSLGELMQLACVVEHIIIATQRNDCEMVLDKIPQYMELKDRIKSIGDNLKRQQVLDFAKYVSEEMEQKIVRIGLQALFISQEYRVVKTEKNRKKWEIWAKSLNDPILYQTCYADIKEALRKYFKIKKVELNTMKKSVQNDCLLTISLLVSNRKDTIRKCMESIKPLLEAVPSELIVVDTGSTDGSIEIVKEYTDNIITFTWCNDFSAARNAGLKLAKGKWFLYLDDDEWFEDVSELITFFQSGEYKNYDGAWYLQRNYADFKGTNYADAPVERMHRLRKGDQFVGRVHETFSADIVTLKIFSCYVHHYGYVYKNEEEKKRHSERNLTLLKAELEEQPKNLRVIAHLLQEYRASGYVKEAKELCEKTITAQIAPYENLYMQYVIVNIPFLEIMGGHLEQAQKKFQEVYERYPLNDVSRLSCIVEEITLAEHQNDWSRALIKLRDYFVLLDKMRKLGNAIKLQESMTLGEYHGDPMANRLLQEGIWHMFKQNDFSLLQDMLSGIQWIKCPEVVQGLLDFLIVYEQGEQIEQGKRKEVIQHYFVVSTGKYDAMLVSLCLQKPFFVNDILEYIDFTTFREGVALYLKANLKEIVPLQQLELLWDKKWLLFLLYFKMVVYEEQILSEKKVSGELFWKSIETILAYSREYFSENLLEKENWAMLPRNCQFAYWMQEAVYCKEAGNHAGWNENVKKAAQCYPLMIQAVQDILKEKTKKISPEMEQLAMILKQNIKKLIETGQFYAAKELVMELEQYIPGDEELNNLKQTIEDILFI